ncbi:hypothetical protein ACLKA6_017528 [Drosophila palustris]
MPHGDLDDIVIIRADREHYRTIHALSIRAAAVPIHYRAFSGGGIHLQMDREEWTALSELFGHRADDEDFIPWELCVPRGKRKRVLQECHDAFTAGQQGLGKTVTLPQQYYWPGLFRDATRDEEEQETQKEEPRTATVVVADKDDGERGDD